MKGMIDMTSKSKFMSYSDIEDATRKQFESDLVTSDYYYIDLQLLKDFQVGALLYILDHDLELSKDIKEKIYNSLTDNYVAYMKRAIDEIIPYIKLYDLDITQEKINSMINDPRYSEAIFNYSPNTYFLDTLKSNILINVNHSMVKDKFRKRKITKTTYTKEAVPIWLYINTYPLKLSQFTLRMIADTLCQELKVNIRFINKPANTLPFKLIDRIDEFYVYYLQDLLQHSHVKTQMEQWKFLEKRIFASPFFRYESKDDFMEEQDERYTTYQRVTSVLIMVTKFQYLQRKILSVFGN